MAVADALGVIIMAAAAAGSSASTRAHDVILFIPLAQMLEEHVGPHHVFAFIKGVTRVQVSLPVGGGRKKW